MTGAVETTLADALYDPSLDPLFWPSARPEAPSAWRGHVPFAHWLVASMRPALIVELGVYTGVSYSAFCEAVRRLGLPTRCLGVDTWRGDDHGGFYDDAVFDELTAFHQARYADFSTLLRRSFDEALPAVADGAVDLLHIDGHHTYEQVSHDFETWRPKLSRRAVVLFHDTCERARGFGVWRLWDELAERHPHFGFTHSHGLGVLAYGDDAPAAVRALCDERDPARIDRLRARFAYFGHAAMLQSRDFAAAPPPPIPPPPAPVVAPPVDRRASILRGVVPGVGRSLEIGALHRALLRKGDGEVFFADHLSTQDLLEKYRNDPGVPPQDLAPVDFVIGPQGLKTAVAQAAPFTTIVASHVLEHVPDLIGWLADAHELLAEGGRLCLALPDKRYTFDVLRRCSTLKDALDAAAERRTRPPIELVCDAFRNSCGVTAADLWGGLDPSTLVAGLSLEALRDAVARQLAGAYVDVHCWVFSPADCVRLLRDVAAAASFSFEPTHFRATEQGGEEFHLQLRKAAAPTPEIWAQAVAAATAGTPAWSGPGANA